MAQPKKKQKAPVRAARVKAVRESGQQKQYRQAFRLAVAGDLLEAQAAYQKLLPAVTDVRLKALVRNDLASLATLVGDHATAQKGFHDALVIDPELTAARLNLAMVEAELALAEEPGAAAPV